jgi:hypothetical protein
MVDNQAARLEPRRKFWRRVKPWHFLIPFALSLIVGVFALRANNLHMLQLRNNVIQADKKGGDVEAALEKLQSYVTRHMNTNLHSGPNAVYPPIQLKYSYQRQLKQHDSAANQSNSQIYTDAQKYCEAKIPHGFSGRYRLSCVQSYISQHHIKEGRPIPKGLYQFDFVSPVWSPDLAGWSLLATAVFLLLFAATFIYQHVLRFVFRRHR